MNRIVENIYFKSPVILQNFLISAYGYKLFHERYSGNHDKYLKVLLKTQWYTKEKLMDLINKTFVELFNHAILTVPFYQKLLEKGIISKKDIRSIEDIKKLPIISKEMIRENPTEFLSKKYKEKSLITINTSGTTGKTLNIFVDRDSRRYAYAFFSRLKDWADIKSELKNVTFAGRTIVRPDETRPPFWRRNIKMNNYLFSSYHLSPDNIKFYVDKLKSIQPHYIDSYPSSLYKIADYMKNESTFEMSPKAIITSSETLFDYQRETIEKVFGCPIFDQYGCAEQVVFVSQCEKGTYHVHPEFGFVEFIRENGSEAMPGESARLICTGFTNLAMPLIRYDIGDTGILSNQACLCGRNFPVIEKILGRTDDILIMRDGRHVGRLDPVFKGLQSIKEAQIIQEDFDTILLKIVPDKGYIEEEIKNIVWELKKRLGSQAVINVDIVEKISRTATGKFRAVISKVRKN